MTNQDSTNTKENVQTTGAPTAKTVSLNTPTPRSQAAKSFLTQETETQEEPKNPAILEQLTEKVEQLGGIVEKIQEQQSEPVRKKLSVSDRKHKAAVRYMQQQGIKDLDSINYTRLNCDIPSDLHSWLNMFARSGGDYSSMTEIAIELLGTFAKEHGFKVREK